MVVGTTLRDETDPVRALEAVAGYVLAHDVSDRAMQLERGGTWTKGKSADTFCPVGPVAGHARRGRRPVRPAAAAVRQR